LLRRWGNRSGPRVGDGSYLGCKTGTLAAQAVVIASRTNELSGDATGVKDHLLLLGRQITEVRLSGVSQRPKLVTQAPVVLSRTIELSGDVAGASDHLLLLGRQITEIRLSRGVSQRPKLVTQTPVVLGRTIELSGDVTGASDHLLLLGRKLAKVRGALLGAQYRRGDLRESEGTNRGKHGRAQVYRHWLRG